MATPEYPSTLPGPSSLSIEPVPQVLASDNEQGPRAVRRRTRVPGAGTPVTFRFLESDYTTFVEWWKTDLKYGHKWFWIQLPSAGGITWHVARFAERYNARMEGHRYWTVDAQLEVRERQLTPNDRADAYFFLEDFENGFGAYSALSGNTSIFTVRPGMTENCMHCAPQSSGSVAAIQRVLAEPVLATFISFRFRVTLANSDDGCLMTLSNGASVPVLSFNPIREGFFDPVRRPKVYIFDGSTTHLYEGSTAQVTVGKIYRVEIAYSPLSGQTRYTLIDELTSSVVYTFQPAGVRPPITFDRITFTMDSGVTTSETDYDDIFAQ